MNNTNKAGIYVLRAGNCEKIQVTINAFGVVTKCDDWEQMSGTPSKSERHRGDKAAFFRPVGFATYAANANFFEVAEYYGPEMIVDEVISFDDCI